MRGLDPMMRQLKRLPLWAWGLLIVAALGGAALAAWIPRYTTSDPNYCLTCHGEGGGLPNRGIPSKVHPPFSEVRCVDCHSKPHQLLYDGYRQGFMAEPDRIGPNCLKCHEEIAERVDEAGFKYNPLQIRIPHKLHLDLGSRCVDCHYNIAHDLRPNATNRPRMEYCAQCHAVTTEACAKCHPGGVPEGPMPVIRPTGVLGDGRSVYQRYCAECHGEKGDEVAGVELRSREFLEREGDAALRRIAREGHGGMPAFGRAAGGPLTDDEIRALAAYLKITAEGIAANGQALFETYCVTCHGSQGDKVAEVRLNDPEFLKARGHEEILKAVQEGRGGMPAFSVTRGGPLAYEEVLAVVRYLDKLAGVTAPSPATLFANQCASCHGPDGARIPTANLASKELIASKTDEELYAAIAQGVGGMPGFGPEAEGPLSEEEVRALVKYLKELAGIVPRPAPPPIPHSLVGMDNCLNCHGPDGFKPVPADHEGRTEDTCRVCHKPKE